jgi:multiple sugar transport system ATP-binding protein
MATIVLDGVTKVFGNEVVAVNEISLEIGDGEFMVLVGPSGCGKSTILRILAGLEEVTAGELYIDGRQVTDLPPNDRDVAMVFQNYALYPHMTVEQNLGFGLRLRKMPKTEIKERVMKTATILGLESLLERKPVALSGGQRQRVAMGRAMVREPVAFLMDEPLSNLDAKLRVQMRAQLAQLHERLGTTTVYVTHDQVEAMTLGQRVAVLRDGVLQQVDTPQNLYAHPSNLFVAAFIGSPPMNLVEATIEGRTVRFAGFQMPLDAATDLDAYDGRTLVLGIRPSDLEDAGVWSNADLPSIEVHVDVTEELGSEVNVLFAVDAPPVAVEETMAAVDEPSEEAMFLLQVAPGEQRTIFCARVDARTKARPGGTVRLSLDPGRFHFFDPESGLAIGARRPAASSA